MRNAKLANWFMLRAADYSNRFADVMTNNGPMFMADFYADKVQRLKNVLEFRYGIFI